MASPLASRSPCQNPPPTSKDEPAGPAPTEGGDTYTPAPVVSRTPTSAPPAALIPTLAPAAVDSTVRYSEADLQRIIKIVLETRRPALIPQPLVFPDGPCKRPLKARFPKLYCGKTYMECYNFIQQCKDHFATAGAKKPSCVPFTATFLRERTLFRWQQHKANNADKTDVLLTWKEFKAFFCQSLRKSQAFVDYIWKIIRRDSHYQ